MLGENLYNEVTACVPLARLTEVRLRLNMPIAVKNEQNRYFLRRTATREIIDKVLERATNFSLYAHQDEIASGYIHCKGGIRLGVSGRGVIDSGKLAVFKDITSLNIRVPHEVIGCSAALKSILDDFDNTLIVAPPFAGKTTLIRDMARVLSDRFDLCIIDEREEIAGRGEYRLGKLCDVVSGVPKGLAYEGIIRSMSPEIIVLDEVFPLRDLKAVEDISRSGVKFVASLHGDDFDRLIKAFPEFMRLFRYGVLLSYKPRVGSIKSIVRFGFD